MTEHHRTTEYDEIEYYSDLYLIYPDENEITTLSLPKYHFMCIDWFDPYYYGYGEDTIKKLDQLPTLRSDLIQHDWTLIQLAACDIEVPEGLLDLPVCYVKCIIDMIENTQWAFYPGTSPKIVFGWKSVKRFEESLEIEFHRPIPHPDHDWDQTADLLFTLHSRLEGFAWNLKYNDKPTD